MPGNGFDKDPHMVKVSIRKTERLRGLTYAERRTMLEAWMNQLIAALEGYQAKISAETLSPLGQSVEAHIPEKYIAALSDTLEYRLGQHRSNRYKQCRAV